MKNFIKKGSQTFQTNIIKLVIAIFDNWSNAKQDI